MPSGVGLAIGVLGLYVLLHVLVGAFAFAAVCAAFLLWLTCGHPLARRVALFAAWGALLLGAWAVFDGEVVRARLVPVSVAVVVGLTNSTARRFFDLHCYTCQDSRVRPRGVLCRRIICRECGREWKPHEERSDLTAFD